MNEVEAIQELTKVLQSELRDIGFIIMLGMIGIAISIFGSK
jgi:hypothetical protein